MTTKDWKKIRSDEKFKHISHRWHNSKINESMVIFNWREEKKIKPYEVMGTNVLAGQNVETIWKEFKTKKQALAYAKVYMRKH